MSAYAEFITRYDKAEACLRFSLERVPEGPENGSIRMNIELALQDDDECRLALKAHGIRVATEMVEEGFIVANRAPSLVRHFAATKWHNYRWYRVLRPLHASHDARHIHSGNLSG